MRSTLRARLLVSHLAVALVGITALIGAGSVVGGALLERQRRAGNGGGAREDDARDAIASVLPPVLVVGGIAALVAAAVAALLVTRAIMGPLASIQVASRRVANGDYGHRVPAPRDQELAHVASDIDALAARLGETEARRSRLIDEVAHEMRTPVTIIVGTMEALLDRVIEPDPEAFERVAAEASRLSRLAEDLSTLSRAEEHALVLARTTFDLAALTQDVAHRLEEQVEHTGIAVTFAGPVIVNADPDRVTQIVVNLLGNAMRHGGENSTIDVDVRRDGPLAVVSVHDTGVGLAPDDVERVFERFYRVPDAMGSGGRGIGLTIARSLARAHGGDVTASSAGLGKGATFVATLPR